MKQISFSLKSVIFFILIYWVGTVKADNTLDSLFNALKKSQQDTSQIKTLFEITDFLINDNNPDAKKYALKAYEKSLLIKGTNYFNQSISLYLKSIENEQNQIQKFQFIDNLISLTYKDYAKKSIAYMYKSLMYESLDSNIKAAHIYELASQSALKSKDTLTIIDVYTSKGIFYKRKSNNTLALEALITALRYSEYSAYNEGIFPICINLGTIYEQMLDLDKAIALYKKAEKKISSEDDPNGNAIVNYKIGKVLLKQQKYNEAKEKLEKVYKIHIQRDDKKGLIVSAAALSGIYFELKQYEEFLYWMNISLKNAEITNDQQGLASAFSSYGRYYAEVVKDYNKALEYYNKNLTLDLGKVQLQHISLLYKQLYILYEKQGEYKKAFNYYKLYSTMNDSLYNSNNVKKQTELKLNYEFDKIQRQKEIENKVKESEQKMLLDKERQRRNFFIVAGILALLLLLLSYRSYRIKRKANTLLEKQKFEIERQKKIVDEKNKKISDSINYARHIQTSILPLHEELKNSFPSHLLYYKPKDVVSGDFYWHISHANKIFFAVADCTGHGVPGSIMSMIGNILLNEIIHEKKIYEPALILNTLSNFVKLTLRQNANLTNRVKDGMDIALCTYDKTSNKLIYAGANIPLYVVNNTGEITIYKPDKAAIGGYTDDKYCFSQTEVIMHKNDWAYIFSDGFIDQFGGDKNKKYSIKRMKDLFVEMINLSSEEKYKILEKAHLSWQDNNEQTDDILVFGFELENIN